MKFKHHLVAGFCTAAALLLTGCLTGGFTARSQEKSDTFSRLTPAVQKHLENGNVEKGYTDDMVYIALGKPSKIENRESPDGPVQVWIYKNMALPNTGGFQGLQYNTDHAIGPGYAPNTSIASQNANQARSSTSQQGNYINSDAVAAGTELPDLPTGTLYIFLFQGRVFKMSIKT